MVTSVTASNASVAKGGTITLTAALDATTATRCASAACTYLWTRSNCNGASLSSSTGRNLTVTTGDGASNVINTASATLPLNCTFGVVVTDANGLSSGAAVTTTVRVRHVWFGRACI